MIPSFGFGLDTHGTNPVAFGLTRDVIDFFFKNVNDTSVGTETDLDILLRVPLNDSGSGIDVEAVLAKILLFDLTPTANENVANVIAKLLVWQGGFAGENLNIVVDVPLLLDTGAGADQAGAKNLVTDGDIGTGTDVIANLLAALQITDISDGNDTLDIVAQMNLNESGIGAESLALLAQLPTLTDTGVGTDQIASLLMRLGVSDTASTNDVLAAINVAFTLTDLGATVERIDIDPGFRIVKIEFSFRKRTIDFDF